MIVLQRWKPDLKQDDLSFIKRENLDSDPWFTHSLEFQGIGWKLGKLFSNCFNVVIPEHSSKEGKMIRCLVEFDFDKPLLRGSKIKWEDKIIWVDFKYGHLPMFCCYCGTMGHSEKVCATKMADSTRDKIF